MTPLARLTIGDQLSSGIYPGQSADAAPLWADGENVIFDEGGIRKNYGLLSLTAIAARPTGLISTVASTERRAYIGAGTSAYRYRTSDGLTNIGGFASSGGIYEFLPWDTWVLINNGVDPLEVWQNSGSSAPITAPFTRANTIFGYQLQAFAAGTNNGGDLIEWSPVNNILDWTVTITGTAGNLRLRELAGDIVATRPLGNGIGIYSSTKGGLFQYLGGTSYGFRKPIRGVGAVSPYSVVEYAGTHFGVLRDQIFQTDLTSFRTIDEIAVRKYLIDNFDLDRLTEVYGWVDVTHNMIRWAIPKLGGGVFGLGYRVDNGVWTRFNDSVIGGDSSGPFTDTLLLKDNKLLRQDKAQFNNDGSAMSAFVRTKPLDFGDGNRIKRMQKISIKGSWTGTVEFKLGFVDHPNANVSSWALTVPLANEILFDRFGVQTEGLYVVMEIGSTAAGANWRIKGVDVYGDFVGYGT